MAKNKSIILGLLAILVIGLLLVSGCVAGTTTNPDGTTTTPTWYEQYGIFIFIIVIFGLMYLFMIRPQRKRQKEQQKMMADLQRGDRVITTSGIYGQIDSLDENSVVLKLEGGGMMRVVRNAIAGKTSTD